MKWLAWLSVGVVLAAGPAVAADKLTVETSIGCSFDIDLRADLAPKHVERVTTLAGKGFYDGVVFHRVIDGFMAQTGDPTGTGAGGSDLPDLPAEFSKEHFGRGVVGAARTSDPNSANSQFFIMFADGGFLDGQYTVFGKVSEEGMACVDRIARGEPPENPDKMLKVTAP
ncbi:MAG TPA: peptidylprolyl isomerase [Aestuariivirga sp.]|mgnify:CR=1 FL=1|nr:peptidylprolyl isomerase [Aestuariivirga sp.]